MLLAVGCAVVSLCAGACAVVLITTEELDCVVVDVPDVEARVGAGAGGEAGVCVDNDDVVSAEMQ